MDKLSSTLSALADPTRRSILVRLSHGPATVNEIAEPFKLTQQAISKHLTYLEHANLIEKRREGRQHFCSLKMEPLQEISTWVRDCHKFWSESFNRLDHVLEKMKKERKNGPK